MPQACFFFPSEKGLRGTVASRGVRKGYKEQGKKGGPNPPPPHCGGGGKGPMDRVINKQVFILCDLSYFWMPNEFGIVLLSKISGFVDSLRV